MKTKIKTISLVLAASLVLNGCNSGTTGTTTQSENAATTKNSITISVDMNKVNSDEPPLFPTFITSGMTSLLSSGLSTVGGMFWNYITTGSTSDSTTQKLDEINRKLDKVQNSLDSISTDLKTNLGVSQTIYSTLSGFYSAATASTLQSVLGQFDTDTKDIYAKYKNYTDQDIFGDVTPADYTKLYDEAQKNCNSTSKINVILGNSNSSAGTTDLLNKFVVTYVDKQATVGSLYYQLDSAKSAYLLSLNSKIGDGVDIMSYLNFFDSQMITYSTNMLGSLQKIYNMQAAQLAYKYACNTNVSLSNVKDLPSGNTKADFIQSIERLNAAYEGYDTKLTSNLKDHVNVLSNTEKYALFSKIFNGLSFLDADYFNKDDSTNSCTVTKLNFSTTKSPTGMLLMNTKCSDGKNKYDYKYEIPYAFNATTTPSAVSRIGIVKVGFNPVDKKPSYSRPLSSSAYINGDDLKIFDDANANVCKDSLATCKYQYHWVSDSNATLTKDSGDTKNYTQRIYWGKLDILAGESILFYNKTSLQNYYNNADWVQRLFDRYEVSTTKYSTAPVEYDSTQNTLSRKSGVVYIANKSTYEHYHQIQDLAMGEYNGKVFSIRIVTEHGSSNDIYTRGTISCLSSENGCFKQDETKEQTILQWNDGTKVTLKTADDGEDKDQEEKTQLHKVTVTITGLAPTPTPVPVRNNTVFEPGTQANGSDCPDNEDVVIDKVNNLMWIESPTSTTYSGNGTTEAKKGIPSQYCGYTDWHLPTTDELLALKKSTKTAGKSAKMPLASWLNGNGFNNVHASDYLTSEIGMSRYVVSLSMADGGLNTTGSLNGYVWPVRSIK